MFAEKETLLVANMASPLKGFPALQLHFVLELHDIAALGAAILNLCKLP